MKDHTSSEPVFDLLVESRFKNAVLYKLIRERFADMAKSLNAQGPLPLIRCAADSIGIGRGMLGDLINLRLSPYLARSGAPKRIADAVAEYFNMPVEEIFPKSLYKLKLPAVVEREYCSDQVLSLAAAQRENLAFLPEYLQRDREDVAACLEQAISELSPREQKIIRFRFGIGVDPQSLQEISEYFMVDKSRIAQIEAKAFKKLRRPEISQPLRRALDGME